MDPCNQAQEKIARGAPLDSDEQRHALECPRCAAVATAYSLLDATLEAFVHPVPAGFADRVMASIPAGDGPAASPRPWLDRPWLQIAFAHGAALCALFNLARFVMRVFVSDVALGETP